MRAKLWGTRGSIAAAGAGTIRYGGDTSCVEVVAHDGARLILDAGSGIRPLGLDIGSGERVDILLSHLHMDHVQGLPFFGPLLDPKSEVHIWGPISTTQTLRQRLSRYLSPPLFPIRVRDLPNVHFHDVPPGSFDVGQFHVTADLVSHPGSTLGYRISSNRKTLAYIPDHEPAFGDTRFPGEPEWTSGFGLAHEVDVLIHDSQYSDAQYAERIGWGHTSYTQLAQFARLSEAKRLVTFHHDPTHDDEKLDEYHSALAALVKGIELVPGTAELTIEV